MHDLLHHNPHVNSSLSSSSSPTSDEETSSQRQKSKRKKKQTKIPKNWSTQQQNLDQAENDTLQQRQLPFPPPNQAENASQRQLLCPICNTLVNISEKYEHANNCLETEMTPLMKAQEGFYENFDNTVEEDTVSKETKSLQELISLIQPDRMT